MERNAIGLIELSSIASGFQVADTMLKAAEVELLLARSICSGKYIVLIGGTIAAVRSSVEAGAAVSDGIVVDTMVLANVHPSVAPAIAGGSGVTVASATALGVIESFSVASLLEAADAAAKAADVQLIEIRLAMALGGKAFVTLTGDVAAAQAAVDAGAAVIAEKGLLVNKVVIPAPRPELLSEVV